jgi:hypothetical protein
MVYVGWGHPLAHGGNGSPTTQVTSFPHWEHL